MSTERPRSGPETQPANLENFDAQLNELQREIESEEANTENVQNRMQEIRQWLDTNIETVRAGSQEQLQRLKQRIDRIGATFEETEMPEIWREVRERITNIAQTTREQIGDVLSEAPEGAKSMWGTAINTASAGLGTTMEYLGKAAKFVGEKWQQLREMLARSMGGTLHALRDDNIFTNGLRASLEKMLGNYGTFYKTLEARKGDIIITNMAENSAGKIVEMHASASQAGMQLTFEVFLNKTITKAAGGFISLETAKTVTYAQLKEAASQVIAETTNPARETVTEDEVEEGIEEEEIEEEGETGIEDERSEETVS